MKLRPPYAYPAAVVLGFALLASPASATVLYFQDFNTPNSATPLSTFGWSTFSGGTPAPTVVSSGTTTGGIFNTERVAHINLNTTDSASSWFGGLRYTYGTALPTLDLSLLSFTANVYAGGSVGPRGDVTLRIESSANNWIGWTISGTTLTQTNGIVAGGLLSQATHSLGTFNPNATSFNLVLAFANVGTWGNDSSNIIAIDNVSLQVIPEPASAAALFGALALGAAAARRRPRPLRA